MRVLCICNLGQNRSKHLAEYLASKGFETDYGGIDMGGPNPITSVQVEWADTLVPVTPAIKQDLEERFEVQGKRIVPLSVHWTEYDETAMYEKLEEEADEKLIPLLRR